MELNEMGKQALRELCKEAGIKNYGKMTNQAMRDALEAADRYKFDVDAKEEPPVVARAGVFDCMVAQMTGTVKKTDIGTPSVKRTTSTAGFKIEKDREVRNGIKRPSAGGLCRAVWDALDAEVAAGRVPTVRDAKTIAASRGWNQNNASIEFYIWRRFRKE